MYISSLCTSKTRKIHVDLVGNKLEANEWVFWVFISASFLESIGINDLKQWTVRVNSEQMDGIYIE